MVFIHRSSMFGTSIFGTSIFETSIFGTSIFGTSIFGTSIFGTRIFGCVCKNISFTIVVTFYVSWTISWTNNLWLHLQNKNICYNCFHLVCIVHKHILSQIFSEIDRAMQTKGHHMKVLNVSRWPKLGLKAGAKSCCFQGCWPMLQTCEYRDIKYQVQWLHKYNTLIVWYICSRYPGGET